MNIIMNEEQEAKDIIKNKQIDNSKPSRTIQLLIKYYYNKENKTKDEIRILIEDFMNDNYKEFNSTRWQNTLDRLVNKYANEKYQLVDLKEVYITENELNAIKELENIKLRSNEIKIDIIDLQKLAFILLVHAKVYNQINKDNNNWVRSKSNDLLKEVKVKGRDKKKKYKLFMLLKKKDYISFAESVNKTSIQVKYIDNSKDSKVGITVTDFKNPVSQYLNWKKGYCIKCGKKLEQSNNKKKYCNECKKEKDKERYKKYNRKRAKQPQK